MDKVVERRFLEAARRLSSYFPEGDFADDEQPDFLIPTGAGQLGVEVTELCHQPEIDRTKRLGYVAPRAKEIYSKRVDAWPIFVNMVFSRDAEEMSVGDLAKGLSEFVYRHRDTPGTFSWDRCRDLPAGFSMIVVAEPLPHRPGGEWLYQKGFRGLLAEKHLLDACLADKSSKVTTYRKKATEVWLMIINDQWRGAGEVYVDPERAASWTFDSPFDRLLLFCRPLARPESVLELRKAY